jgi:hypothetical protein
MTIGGLEVVRPQEQALGPMYRQVAHLALPFALTVVRPLYVTAVPKE